jgi:predicted ATP-binding protein involved in virulence
VLAAIMNVDPVPQVEEAKWLSEYRAFIEQGQFETRDAMATRGRLMDHFGPDHPVMIDCDRLIRFQSFKLRRNGH